MRRTTKASKIIQKVRADMEKECKGAVTLYLNKKLWKRFKQACKTEGLPASVVAEKLMEEFISSLG